MEKLKILGDFRKKLKIYKENNFSRTIIFSLIFLSIKDTDLRTLNHLYILQWPVRSVVVAHGHNYRPYLPFQKNIMRFRVQKK